MKWFGEVPPGRGLAFVVEIQVGRFPTDPGSVCRVHVLEAEDDHHAVELGQLLAAVEFGRHAPIMVACVRQTDRVEGLP